MSTDPNRPLQSSGLDFVPAKHDSYPFIDPKKQNLKGRNVMITGSSKGIGKAMALSYTAAGASGIVITGRSDISPVADEIVQRAKSCGLPPPKVVALKLDTCDRKSVEEGAEKVKQELGFLDILILNAGALEAKWDPITESNPDMWWSIWETNIYGTYLTMRSFTPLIAASPNPEKTIVGVSSVGAHRVDPGSSAYRITKMALLRMMEVLAVENVDKGVLAFSIHPGGVITDLANNLPTHMHSNLQDTPELAGDTVVWLTAQRKEWLMGRYVSCQWDMEKFLEKKEDILNGDLLKVRMAVNL